MKNVNKNVKVFEKDNKIKGNQEEKRYLKIIEGEKRESKNGELSG